ncbi:tetratricopeptide repeat protein [Nonomuraea sp. NPDC049141]|uniref:ATP-binding protein n=1 Tax=Nonomuraea sp. NPDC049141 TaxID=3155500 RepID=UPI0033F1532B
MTEPTPDLRIDPSTATTAQEFIRKLNELRTWAGQPSLERLRSISTTRGTMVSALAPATTSEILNGKRLPRLPRLAFVETFVQACLAVRGKAASAIAAEVEEWGRVWRRLAAADRATRDMGANMGGDPVSGAGRPAPAQHDAPQQLPTPVAGFTGRDGELAELDRLYAGAADHPALVVVSGTAGVGKTALAVVWSRTMAGRFPGGQLYVDLRGYDPAAPMSAGAAMEHILRSLGAEKLPADPDHRASLYQRMLAERALVLVFDNAKVPGAVRPLLPRSGGHLVVVTSRDSMAGLIAREGARRLLLGPLSDGAATDLLRGLIQAEDGTVGEASCAELNHLCAGLPLTLRVAAERLSFSPGTTLLDLIAQLRREDTRLDLLDAGGDTGAGLRAVLNWSLKALPAAAARLFRLLGLLPGADFDVHAATALADTPLIETRRILEVLHSGHLIEETSRGRYRLHDLLRMYAAEQVSALESTSGQAGALTRLLDWYAHSIQSAVEAVESFRPPFLPPAQFDLPASSLSFRAADAAWEWLAAERVNLVAAVRLAAATGRAEHAWRICDNLACFFYLQGGDEDWIDLHQRALAAARTGHDALGVAVMTTGLASAYGIQGQRELALEHRLHAVSLYQRIGFRHGEAVAEVFLADAYFRRGSLAEAEKHCVRAYTLARTHGDYFAEILARWGQARVHSRTGRHAQAWTVQLELLELAERTGAEQSRVATQVELATTYLLASELAQAMTHFDQALQASRQIGDRISEVRCLTGLGAVWTQRRDPERAVRLHEQALALSERLYLTMLTAEVLQELAQAHDASGNLPAADLCRRRAEEVAEHSG